MIGMPFHSEAGWPAGLSPATGSDVEVGGSVVLSGVIVAVKVGRTMEVDVGTSVGLGDATLEQAERIIASSKSRTMPGFCIKPSLFDLVIIELNTGSEKNRKDG